MEALSMTKSDGKTLTLAELTQELTFKVRMPAVRQVFSEVRDRWVQAPEVTEELVYVTIRLFDLVYLMGRSAVHNHTGMASTLRGAVRAKHVNKGARR
jgi:hypothetical protein